MLKRAAELIVWALLAGALLVKRYRDRKGT
jgi:hypothetical protein